MFLAFVSRCGILLDFFLHIITFASVSHRYIPTTVWVNADRCSDFVTSYMFETFVQQLSSLLIELTKPKITRIDWVFTHSRVQALLPSSSLSNSEQSFHNDSSPWIVDEWTKSARRDDQFFFRNWKIARHQRLVIIAALQHWPWLFPLKYIISLVNVWKERTFRMQNRSRRCKLFREQFYYAMNHNFRFLSFHPYRIDHFITVEQKKRTKCLNTEHQNNPISKEVRKEWVKPLML